MTTLPYFYYKDLISDSGLIALSEETSRHCIQVLRMQEGEALHLTDGKGLKMLVTIHAAHKKNCTVKSVSYTNEVRSDQKNTIAISLLKNTGRFEWFLEKATELGIDEIVPLVCKRTERQQFKKERLETICISAMLQSRQTYLPVLQDPVKFEVFIKNNSNPNKLIAHCLEEDKNRLQNCLQKKEHQVILIGPEGDFTPEEIAMALSEQFKPVSLGNTRLRSETAGIIAATLMQLT